MLFYLKENKNNRRRAANSEAPVAVLLSYRKLRFHTIINAPRGSHCGGMEECRLRDPPQAENPASQDSFLFHRKMRPMK